ncbi:MAG: PLP-dependent aminotransferase family protein [Burkholderiales bacterium]|jgi:GntR family transcriptional regulator/MocR family aminotransferase|nr:PLP-dependent aminotransferase family protein [Burkholderiales bacterium]
MEPVLPFELKLEGIRPGGLTKALHRQLRAAIIARRLPDRFALPSTRRLADILGVGRNTVIAAYDLLVSEGHALARPGARMVVTGPADAAQRKPLPEGGAQPSRQTDPRIAKVWRQPAERLVHSVPIPARCFRTGVPEDRHFDHDAWRRLTARALRDAARSPFNYGPPAGLPALREAIAGHVAFVRAVVCGPEDLIVTSGAQQAFDLLARLLVTPGRTRVVVEDPGFPATRAAFAAAGALLAPVPVDEQGLRIDCLPNDAKVICVTPSHQSPTGVVMSAARRAELLQRARTLGAVVIEDDYDGEFLFDAHPQDALQTLDCDERVFYVGTFSKSLFPDLRKGFVVAPPWAREALIDVKRSTDSHGDRLTQAALAAFIAEGHLARHIRRMRPIYAQRRQALERGLERHLAQWLQVLPGNAGLHLSARVLKGSSAAAIFQAARDHLPGAVPLSAYAVNERTQGLCIGYGCMEVDPIARAVRAMGRALAGQPGLPP